MSDDAATLAVAALDYHPHPELMTQQEVRNLVDAIGADLNTAAYQHSISVSIGGEMMECRYREIRIGNETLHYSPRMRGLFERRAVPPEPGIKAKAQALVQRHLAARRYKGPPIIGMNERPVRGMYGFESIEVVTMRPEGGNAPCGVWGFFEHQPDEELEENARKVAEQIDLRHRNRHKIAGRVHGARLWIEEALAAADGIDGMKLEDVEASMLSYNSSNDIQSIHVYCRLRTIGDTLEPTTINAMAHNDENLRKTMSSHRKALRKMATADDVGDTRTVDPIVAAAVRAGMHLYGETMLEEIEAVLDKRHIRATSPVKRGITLFRMKGGELTGPVTLKRGKQGVRYHKGRVNAKAVTDLPDTLKAAMPGMRMRDVIDHPWLDGLVIQSLTINSIGLNLRPKPMGVPLAPLLEELRASVAARKAKG